MKIKNRVKTAKFLALGLAAVLMVGQFSMAYADQEDIDNMADQISETEQRQAEITASINNLEAAKQALIADIGTVEGQLIVTIAAIGELDNQIANTEAQLEQTQTALA